MTLPKPTIISTFSGCGGSSLGYKMAGFQELLAIDFEDNSCEVFKLNFPDTPVWNRDIKDVTGKEILEFCKIKKGELDVLDGSPPCQGFSLAGKREVADDRNVLFREFVRLIEEIEPKVFLMENVTGVAKGVMKGNFNEIMKTLGALNYTMRCRQMNSKNYGVPQSRDRLIWLGVRKDLKKEPSFPVPSKNVIPVRKAFEGLPVDDHTEGNEMYRQLWGKVQAGKQFSTVHPKGHWYNEIKINPNKPSPTITKTIYVQGASGLTHWKHMRHLNIAELKRLASFPDDFKLIGTYEQQWARIGNAVMPKFMEQIALTIKKNILS